MKVDDPVDAFTVSALLITLCTPTLLSKTLWMGKSAV